MGACSAAWLTVTACLQVRVVCNALLAALEQGGIHRVKPDNGGQQAQVGLREALAAHKTLAAGEARVGGGQGQHVRWHRGSQPTVNVDPCSSTAAAAVCEPLPEQRIQLIQAGEQRRFCPAEARLRRGKAALIHAVVYCRWGGGSGREGASTTEQKYSQLHSDPLLFTALAGGSLCGRSCSDAPQRAQQEGLVAPVASTAALACTSHTDTAQQ